MGDLVEKEKRGACAGYGLSLSPHGNDTLLVWGFCFVLFMGKNKTCKTSLRKKTFSKNDRKGQEDIYNIMAWKALGWT